jgi:hypothetical protein
MGAVCVSGLETSNFSQGQEIKHLSGGVVLYAAQSNVQFDAWIAEKGGFRTETNQSPHTLRMSYSEKPPSAC